MTVYRPVDWVDWIPPDVFRVGDDGTVWRWMRAGKTWKRIYGYYPKDSKILWINLSYKFRKLKRSLPSLVLRAFVGPRPIGCLAMHYPDRDPDNNRLANLRYAPRGSQKFDAPGQDVSSLPNWHLRGTDNPGSRIDEDDVRLIFSFRREGWTVQDIADELEETFSLVWGVLRRRTWKHVAIPEDSIGLPKRTARGSRSGVSKLVEDDIPRIFAARREGKTLREIAAEFEVSIATIGKILNRQLWGHVAVDTGVDQVDEMMVVRA